MIIMKKLKYHDELWFNRIKLDKEDYMTIRLIEKEENSRHMIKEPLIEKLINYYMPLDIIDYYLDENEDMGELERIINGALPCSDNDKTRKGDFSEIISSEHLVQNYGYYFPYIKLQNKPNSEMSNQGDDILGFKFNDVNEIIEICVGEVKFLANFNNNIFKKAHSQLKKSYNPRPKSLRMVVHYAINQKNKFSKEFIKLLSEKTFLETKISNWIFCVTEKCHDDIDICNETDFLDNLTLISIYLPEISPFIHEVYDLSSGYYNE